MPAAAAAAAILGYAAVEEAWKAEGEESAAVAAAA
jgi:hypothetical protein